MKVGGNESATKYFRANGGSAALASKDPKTKYQSAAATKYKEELKKRAARDALEFPDEVVIADAADTEGTSTPASEPADDFFSSWDKPSIKRPTPPISRTATPPVVGRTPSPFLNAGANGKDIARSTSPLAKTDSAESKPAASRITHSAALRKTTTGATGARKTNVLGAKKNTKLGAKKVTGDVIDFDEAEKKAKEEAERIAKLGYDPEAEEAAVKKTTAAKAEATNIVAPTPVGPQGYGSGHSRQKSAAEVERLGMGFGRLGFGQVGGAKPAAATAAKKNAGGFGSVGPVKATTEGTFSHVIWTCGVEFPLRMSPC
jgi:ADP-ribosylation factor GTPase-activating protein 2/3